MNAELQQMSFGERVRMARITANMSQAEVGELIDVSGSHIAKIEAGINGGSDEVKERLTLALGLNNPDQQVHFGAICRRERRAKGWQQWELAKVSGLNPNKISAIENYKQIPTKNEKIAIEQALSLNVIKMQASKVDSPPPFVPESKPLQGMDALKAESERRKRMIDMAERIMALAGEFQDDDLLGQAVRLVVGEMT